MQSNAFAWQVLCLRLAVIVSHARADQAGPVLGLTPDGRNASISCPEDWVESTPRTLFLLREEALAWTRSGPLRLLV
jgi:exopolyphosphatase/guanosine-5'-triphosphate,3'-diphosphate pyrophosphatase